MENPETSVEVLEDYDAAEEGIPTMIMSNVKPVIGKKSSGNKAVAALSGLAATGAVAGGLAYAKKKKDAENSEELDDHDDEELADDIEYTDKVTDLEEDRPWLNDYGLGISRSDIDNDDIGFN